MKKAPEWTNHQVAKLKAMCGKETPERMAQILNRSPSAIRTKAVLLGLSVSTRAKKPKPERKPGVYKMQVNRDTRDYIRKMIDNVGIEAVAQRLKLKPESLRKKIYHSEN